MTRSDVAWLGWSVGVQSSGTLMVSGHSTSSVAVMGRQAWLAVNNCQFPCYHAKKPAAGSRMFIENGVVGDKDCIRCVRVGHLTRGEITSYPTTVLHTRGIATHLSGGFCKGLKGRVLYDNETGPSVFCKPMSGHGHLSLVAKDVIHV